MRCNDYNEQISAYLDGVLSEAEAEALTVHLGECEACKETLAALQVIQKELRSIEGIQIPENFHECMMSKVREERERGDTESPKVKHIVFKKLRYLWPVAAAAVLVLVINQNTPKQTIPVEEMKKNSSSMAIEGAVDMEIKKMPATLSATPEMARSAAEVIWSIQSQDPQTFTEEMMIWAEEQGCKVEQLSSDMTYLVDFPTNETKEAFLKWATESVKVNVSGQVDTPQLSVKIMMK